MHVDHSAIELLGEFAASVRACSSICGAASLGYEHLDEVQAGDGAQLAFLELRSDDIARERACVLRQALLKYCLLDTWSMVVLRRLLCGEALGVEG